MLKADFEAQLPLHLPKLRGLAKRLVGDPDDAQDVVQEALLRASRALAEFRGDASLKTWLYQVTTRTALDHLRAAKRWDKQVMVEACDERGRDSMVAKFASPEVSFDVGQHISFCFTCIGRTLEPEGHAAIVLSEVFELSNAEAAEVMQLTEPAFRHTLSAGRAAMRSEYEGLCALVNKTGACYQCRALREMAPEGRKGPALPAEPMPVELRMELVKSAQLEDAVGQRLNDYFFRYVKGMAR